MAAAFPLPPLPVMAEGKDLRKPPWILQRCCKLGPLLRQLGAEVRVAEDLQTNQLRVLFHGRGSRFRYLPLLLLRLLVHVAEAALGQRDKQLALGLLEQLRQVARAKS